MYIREANDSSRVSQETDDFNNSKKEFVSWRSLVESEAFYIAEREKRNILTGDTVFYFLNYGGF